MLTDPLYQEQVSKLSELIMDQPQHPLDRAVWWLEYLLRHPHNPDMRSHTHNLNWAQYFLLDVLAFIIAVLATVIFIIVKIVKYCCCKTKRKQD